MSMRMALGDLNPRLRAMAEERLAALPMRTIRPMGVLELVPPRVTQMSRSKRDRSVTKAGRAPKPSVVELLLWQIERVCRLPTPVTEHRFHPTRKWRFDLAWPDVRLAIEIDGVTYEGGRHQRIAGFTEDLKKHNAAVALNWRVLYGTPKMVRGGAFLDLIERTYG